MKYNTSQHIKFLNFTPIRIDATVILTRFGKEGDNEHVLIIYNFFFFYKSTILRWNQPQLGQKFVVKPHLLGGHLFGTAKI